ncbi:MAG: hypothetical protein WEH44_06670, partial [Pirellulaceae bacterium]
LTDGTTHLLSIWPGPGHALLRSGVSIPCSPEYRDLAANEELLFSLAAMRPPGGKPGEIIRLPRETETWGRFAGPDIFRRDLPRSRSLSGIWPLLVLAAAGLFLLDVGNRRVIVPWNEVAAWASSLFVKRAAAAEAASPLDRLRATKVQAAASHQRSERFELPADDVAESIEPIAEAPPHSPPLPGVAAASQSQENYADRLLRAKRQARHDVKNRRRPGNQEQQAEN